MENSNNCHKFQGEVNWLHIVATLQLTPLHIKANNILVKQHSNSIVCTFSVNGFKYPKLVAMGKLL
jgi:hypothetical protein